MIDLIFLEMNETIWLMEEILWWIGSIISVGLGLFFIKKIWDNKNPAANKFTAGLAIFTITYGVARIIENIRKYFIAGYENRTDIGDAWINSTQITGLNYDLRIMYYVIAWTGIATFYFVSEKYVFKGKYKYILTSASVIEGIVSILNYIPDNGPHIVTTILSAVGFLVAALFPIYLYFNMGLKNTGAIRNSCFIVTIGLFFFIVSVMADLPESTYIVYLVGGTPLPVWIVSILAPIMLFAGMLGMTLGFNKMFSSLVA